MSFNELVGNSFAKNRLSNVIKSSNYANSYIFSGTEGVGKKLFAIEFAKSLLCINIETKPCDNCISCLKIKNGSNENVKIISTSDIQNRKDGSEKYISGIREIEQYLHLKAANNGKKIVIIDNFDKYSIEAL